MTNKNNKKLNFNAQKNISLGEIGELQIMDNNMVDIIKNPIENRLIALFCEEKREKQREIFSTQTKHKSR